MPCDFIVAFDRHYLPSSSHATSSFTLLSLKSHNILTFPMSPRQGQANHFFMSAPEEGRTEYAQQRYLKETKRLYSGVHTVL